MEATNHFCGLAYALFEVNKEGKEFFELLYKQVELPVCHPNKESSWGYFREGQNDVIRQIKGAVEYQKRLMQEGK
jgi:hypothetical protein